MIVTLCAADAYQAAFPRPLTVYGSPAFTAVNASKAEAVRRFAGYDEKDRPRLGITLGLRQGQWLCPFSAPFGELACDEPQSLERIYDFVSELCDTLQGMPLRITLPPAFYAPQWLEACHGVLANMAAKCWWDYNYHYDLTRFPQFEAHLDRAARKNLRRALFEGFRFEKTDDMPRAYAVIKANRDAHGYPLAMTLEQVAATVEPAGPVHADFFVLSLGSDDVAAAMVYDVAPGIAQVVYWGDAPGYSEHRPMNVLPYHLMGYYAERGYRIVDVGPSSSQGIPSHGLCRFKQSIGCLLSLKPTFQF